MTDWWLPHWFPCRASVGWARVRECKRSMRLSSVQWCIEPGHIDWSPHTHTSHCHRASFGWLSVSPRHLPSRCSWTWPNAGSAMASVPICATLSSSPPNIWCDSSARLHCPLARLYLVNGRRSPVRQAPHADSANYCDSKRSICFCHYSARSPNWQSQLTNCCNRNADSVIEVSFCQQPQRDSLAFPNSPSQRIVETVTISIRWNSTEISYRNLLELWMPVVMSDRWDPVSNSSAPECSKAKGRDHLMQFPKLTSSNQRSINAMKLMQNCVCRKLAVFDAFRCAITHSLLVQMRCWG